MFLFIHCSPSPSPRLSPPPSPSPHSAIRQQSSSGSELEQKLHKVFAFITTCEDGSSGRKTGSSTPVSPLAVEARPALLLELASVCVEHHFTQLALQCMDALPRGGGEEVEGGVEAVQKEIIHCQLMVQQLGLGEEDSYARSSVEVCYYWCNEGGWRTRHAREIQCHMLSDRSDCKLWGEWKRLLLQHSDWETLSSFRYSMYDILCTTYYRYLFI